MSDEFHDPRPEGVDAADGVYVLLQRASHASLRDVLATPGVPKVLHMPERSPPTPVADLYSLCRSHLFRRGDRPMRSTMINTVALAMLGGDTKVGAIGYALMTGRHGDTRVVAIVPDSGASCLARVAVPEIDDVDGG